jgi:LacI family transcriptional regulator
MTAIRTRNRKAHGRVTLAEVARAAGVSTATVSRALNAPSQVGDEIGRRVRGTATALGYRPNAAARALAGNRSRLVGIIVPTIANSIFSPGVQAIEEVLEARDYGLVITTSGYDADKELAQAERLMSRGVDGLILVGAARRPALLQLLVDAGVPAVVQGAYDPASPLPCIGFDNRAAMTLMARHVFATGRRRVAILAGISRDNDRVRDRVAAIRLVASAEGLNPAAIPVAECRYDVTEARRAAAGLIGCASRPDAILCINDILAIGSVLAARDAGLSVPADIAVTGFDDFDVAGTFTPPITTIRVPVVEMGRRVAEALLQRLETGAEITSRELPVELVVRGSG